MSLKIFHKTIIILNTPTAIREIIDKRNLSSSNRPKMIIAQRLIPNDANFGTAQFGSSPDGLETHAELLSTRGSHF